MWEVLTRPLAGAIVGALLLGSGIASGALATPGLYSTTAVIPGLSNPTGVETCNGEVFVANFNSGTLSVIDPSTYTVTRSISVNDNPYGLACDGTILFVANYGSNTVSIVNTVTHGVETTVGVGSGPTDIAVAQGYAYVSNQSDGTVSLINTMTRVVDFSLTIGGYPLGVTYAAGQVFVGNQMPGTPVRVIDTTAHAVLPGGVNLGTETSYAGVSRGYVYFLDATAGGKLFKVNALTQSSTSITLPTQLTNLTIANDVVYVTSFAANKLYVVDLNTFALTNTVSVGSCPSGIATYGWNAYISNQCSNDEWVVAIAAPPSVPGAPTSVSAVAGDGEATVSFMPPGSDGGAPITSYEVTSSPGGITATGSGSPITVAGLTNGTSYTFSVTATNIAGPGPASSNSGAVTPAATPTPEPTPTPTPEPTPTPGPAPTPAQAQKLPPGVALPSSAALRSKLVNTRKFVVLSRSIKTDAGSTVEVRVKCAFTGRWLRPHGDVLGCWLTRSADGRVTMHVSGNGRMKVVLSLWASATPTHQALYVTRKYSVSF